MFCLKFLINTWNNEMNKSMRDVPNGGQRNSVYAWILEVWERKGRMGTPKNSIEKGEWGTTPPLSHYCALGFPSHSPIFAKFIRSKMRTWKSLIVQASPWYVDPCSCGLDLQELQKNFCPWTKGGTSVKSFFHCGPPCDSKFENFCSSWRSRPLEHESTHHMEA